MNQRAFSSRAIVRVVLAAALAVAAAVASSPAAGAVPTTRPFAEVSRSAPAPLPAAPSSQAAVPLAAAVRALMRDAHLPWAEAVRHIQRQERLTALAEHLRQHLGPRFGGAWIDHAHGGRLLVAVLDRRAEPPVRQFALASGMPDTAVTLVRRSLADLERIADQLGREVIEANRGADQRLAVWIAVERNAVELGLPASRMALTAAQLRLVERARDRYSDAVVLGSDTASYTPRGCDNQSACDPPLRSGVAIRTDGGRCTSAFPVTAGGRYYVLTAGHCTEAGANWTAGTASYGTVTIGTRAASIFGERGDMGLIGVADPGFWRPAGLVYPESPITSTGTAVPGTVVCKTGSTTGTTCGTVTRTDVTVPYDEATVRGMTYATACVDAGDSGSGVWSGSTAYGIVSGGSQFGCGMVFEPVETAAAAFDVQILRS